MSVSMSINTVLPRTKHTNTGAPTNTNQTVKSDSQYIHCSNALN